MNCSCPGERPPPTVLAASTTEDRSSEPEIVPGHSKKSSIKQLSEVGLSFGVYIHVCVCNSWIPVPIYQHFALCTLYFELCTCKYFTISHCAYVHFIGP